MLRLEEKEGRSSTHHRGHSGKCWLNLVHASKPHKLGVTSLAVDPQGKILASGVSFHHTVKPPSIRHVWDRYFVIIERLHVLYVQRKDCPL